MECNRRSIGRLTTGGLGAVLVTTRRSLGTIVGSLVVILSTSCVTFAPPPPMLTLGGPAVTSPGRSEVAMAVGTGVAFFEDAHSWATGWAGRYNHGLGRGWDLGVDVASVVHSSDGTFTVKLQGRRSLGPTFRLEGGLGAGDDSDGKSLHADVALTAGTANGGPWDAYTSLRFGGALGYPGDVIFGEGVGEDPADAWFGAFVLGAQGEVSARQSVLLEGAFGSIRPVGHDPALFFYMLIGMRFQIGP